MHFTSCTFVEARAGFYCKKTIIDMNKLFRGLLAGYGASKLGGGCLGTIVVFLIIYFMLGQCS
jgi:hypothetical protein